MSTKAAFTAAMVELQKDQARLQERLDRALEALRAFVDGYPDGAWRGLLHEEGCDGTRLRREEREDEGDVCRCDGDDAEDLVASVLEGAS